jgi:hypothetical protein
MFSVRPPSLPLTRRLTGRDPSTTTHSKPSAPGHGPGLNPVKGKNGAPVYPGDGLYGGANRGMAGDPGNYGMAAQAGSSY